MGKFLDSIVFGDLDVKGRVEVGGSINISKSINCGEINTSVIKNVTNKIIILAGDDYIELGDNMPTINAGANGEGIVCVKGSLNISESLIVHSLTNFKGGLSSIAFIKEDSTDAYVLLGGGGHKAISTTGGKDSVVALDSNGDTQIRNIRYTSMDQDIMSGGLVFRVNNSTDNNLRVCTSPSSIRTWLGIGEGSGDISHSHSFNTLLDKPTTLKGYGIIDAASVNGSINNPWAASDLTIGGRMDVSGDTDIWGVCSLHSGLVVYNNSVFNGNILCDSINIQEDISCNNITINGNISQISSINHKTDIKEFQRRAIDIIQQVDIITYKYKNNLETNHIGFIAENTPSELSSKNQNIMDIGSCVGVLIKAVQELVEEIKDLKNGQN